MLLKPFSGGASFGWCSICNKEHRLEQGGAQRHALDLMKELTQLKRIDLHSTSAEADPRFSTDYLFGEARGQMFGILECEDENGEPVILRAFSCQYNGAWNVEGWVPPLFDVAAYDRIMVPGDLQIKEMGRKMEALDPQAQEHVQLKTQRKLLSQSIMSEIQNLFVLQNFHGDLAPLTGFFKHVNGPPTGAGDCCAPKLLYHAARNNLRPLSIAEFYWGKTNRSETREHGCFYSSCADKCQPILGFMLCGAMP